METLQTFVLGALSGLFLIGIIYTFAEVLKIRKTIGKLKEDDQYLSRHLNNLDEHIHKLHEDLKKDVYSTITDLRRDIDNRSEEIDRIMGSNNSDVHQRIDEVHRYIDSRIDKATGVLCQRMDMMFERKPEFENTPKAQEELLKS